jgi:peptidoglycan hydrolase-like protein with peptidoglycan-binding domain/SH3-like domain-containing protein
MPFRGYSIGLWDIAAGWPAIVRNNGLCFNEEMRRRTKKLYLIAVTLSLGCAHFSTPSMSGQLHHPIDLGEQCKAEFERFMDWQEYYKVFAFGSGPRGHACAADVGTSAAVAECNETRGYLDRCKVYAKSPMAGKVAIVWNGRKAGSNDATASRRAVSGLEAQRVNLRTGNSVAIALRSKPSSNAGRVAWIGGSVAVLGYANDGKWVRVKSGDHAGYVRRTDLHADGLKAVSSGAIASQQVALGSKARRVNLNPGVGGAIKLRSKPSSNAGRVAWIGGSVVVLRNADGGKWVKVKSAGHTGYVRSTDIHADDLKAVGAFRPKSQEFLRKDSIAQRKASNERQAAIEAKRRKRQQLAQVQTALQTLGLYGGKVDGVSGAKTRAAISSWLKMNGLAAGAKLTDDLVAHVGRQADAKMARNLVKAKAAQERRRAEQNKALSALRQAHKHAIAVIIGNHDYAGRTPDVAFAGRDADAIRKFVIGDLGYREGNIIDLRDASLTQLNATFGTAGNHRGRLFDYVREGKSDVFVFYSGHGVPGLRDRKGYLLPVDADPNRAELNGYSLDTLLANLAKVPARSMAVYIDACFSGESQKGMLVQATSGITVQAKVPKSSKRMIVVTAAQNDQFASWDEDAKHGLFTKHLLDALRGKADGEGYGNGDGKVTLAELRSYLDEEMTYQARRRWSRDQNASVQGAGGSVLATLH